MFHATPITQRDIAEACQLHPSTVCLALKNSPSISEATRRRIQAAAEELGYSPNVAARNLALLRSERRTAPCLPFAWINQERRRDHWRVDPEARAFFEAAQRRAEENGYRVEVFWTREPGMTSGRILQILRTRGIEGVLFAAHRTFDLSLLDREWNEFSVIGLNDHRLAEWLDVVSPDYFRAADMMLHRLRQLGFTRPGWVTTLQFEASSHRLVRSCFLKHQADGGGLCDVPVCLSPGEPGEAILIIESWYRAHRPDVIVCHDHGLMEAARAAVPDVPWVYLGTAPAAGQASLDTCAAEVAAVAVDCLVEKMRRFERGFRTPTRLHLVRGTWIEGDLAQRVPESIPA